MRKRQTRWMFSAIAVSALLSSCSGSSESASTSESLASSTSVEAATTSTAAAAVVTTAVEATTTAAAPETTTSVPVPVEVFPLTGLPVSDPAYSARPALAAKMDNHVDARPHAGLNQADVVYEEIVEGITRFFVIFHSQDVGPIGPIRSARTTDVDLLNQLNRPLFVWSGGNRGVVNAIGNSNSESRAHGNNAQFYYRDSERRQRTAIEHTLLAYDTSQFYTTVNPSQGPPAPFFTWRAAGAPVVGEPATLASLEMSGVDVGWVWDPATSLYLRSEYGDEHLDASGVRISAENVMIQFCQYRRSPADPGSPEAITVNYGEATLLSGGKVVTGTWERGDPAIPAIFKDSSGKPMELTPGRTWIELAQAGTTPVTIG